MEYFELQPLRIPSGWMVQYNNFSEYDLEKHGEKYRFELVEDLLQLKNHNLLIDLGWYPSMDSAGEYVLYLVDTKKERPFECPIEEFRSRKKAKIIAKLEYWMNGGHCQELLHYT